MSDINHNFWPDGTFRTQHNAFTAHLKREEAAPLTREQRREAIKAAILKATRVNKTISIDPNPQASADKTQRIKGKQ